MAIRNSIKRAGIQMKDPPRAGAKKKLPRRRDSFLYVCCYLFDDVSVQSCKDVIYIAISVDVEIDRFGKIQT